MSDKTLWVRTEVLANVLRLIRANGPIASRALRKIVREFDVPNPVLSSALAQGVKRGLLQRSESRDGPVYSLAPDETHLPSRQVERQQPDPLPAPTSSAAAIYEARCGCGSRFRTAILGDLLCDRCRSGQPVVIPATVTTTPNTVIAPAPIRRMCSCGTWITLKSADDDTQQCAGCVERIRKARKEEKRLNPYGLPGRNSTGFVGSR